MAEQRVHSREKFEKHVPVKRASQDKGLSRLRDEGDVGRSRKASRGDSLGLYLSGIREFPLLTAAEEVELAKHIERQQAEVARMLLRYPDLLREVAPNLESGLVACLCAQMKSVTEGRDETRSNGKGDGKAEGAGRKEDQRLCRMGSIFVQIDLEDAQLKTFVRKLGDRAERLGAEDGNQGKARRHPEERIQRIREDHKELVEAYDSLQRARKKMIESNLRLVVHIAKRYVNRGLCFADLIQEGNFGLLRAVTKFDYRRGNKFSTYATFWIRQAIGRAVREQALTVRLPAHVNEMIGKLRRSSEGTRRALGRRPLLEDVMAEMDLRPEEAQRALWLTREKGVVSLQTPVADGDAELGDLITDRERASVEEDCGRIELARRVRRAVASLQPREAEILRKRFGIGTPGKCTLQELSEEHGLSRERVRQIESCALGKLRRAGQAFQLGDREDAA